MAERSLTIGRMAVAAALIIAAIVLVHARRGVAAAEDDSALRLLLGRCTVCHSTDLITQQRLTPTQWEGTVTKMVQWGAQLTDEEQVRVVAYLGSRFHPDAPLAGHVLLEDLAAPEERRGKNVPVGTVHPAGNRQRGERLFAQTCAPCHGPKAEGMVGPKLSRNPILGEAERFQETVLQGRGAMPAWRAALSIQDVVDIHVWLKGLD